MPADAVPVLAGDVGGTKTRLALFHAADGQVERRVEREYASRDYATFDTLVVDFLGGCKERPAAACIGVAGPVRNDRVAVTNLPWEIDAVELGRDTGIARVALLNDLEATAWSLPALGADALHDLNAGNADPRGNRAIIAAGTGLGEAGLFHDGVEHRPFATEGGHCDFSPGDETGIALLRFLAREHAHVSWERVVSGPGLVNIHAFVRATRAEEIPGWLHAGEDAAADIAARADSDPACRESVELFVRFYGREAGNIALKTLATGGLYLGGGIAPKLLAHLQTGAFLEAFLDKGRMRPLLEAMPVRVILDDRAALTGAARRAVALAGAA
jgi:glucokinase